MSIFKWFAEDTDMARPLRSSSSRKVFTRSDVIEAEIVVSSGRLPVRKKDLFRGQLKHFIIRLAIAQAADGNNGLVRFCRQRLQNLQFQAGQIVGQVKIQRFA